MRTFTIVLLLAGLAGAYHWWSGRTADASAGAEGFVPVQMPDGAPDRAVLVVAPPGCPSEEARRAEALVQELSRAGIPVVRGDSISFNVMDPTAEQRAGVERAVAVFKRGAPAVFVNGLGMSNPTTAQAVSAFRGTRAGP